MKRFIRRRRRRWGAQRAAVLALTGGDLPLTTGLHIPVDAGVAAAFLR